MSMNQNWTNNTEEKKMETKSSNSTVDYRTSLNKNASTSEEKAPAQEDD